MKVFFVSDTHFDHKNIIAYTNRPFPDVETMNQKLIDRWNETVAEGDLVYFLGDFCMRPKQNARRFRSLLNGSIILIKGHIHDSALSGENYTGRYFNVSVENIGYRPVELRRLLELAGI